MIGTISHIIRLNADWIAFCHCLDKLYFNLVLVLCKSTELEVELHRANPSLERDGESGLKQSIF